jgi:hypothetical protein
LIGFNILRGLQSLRLFELFHTVKDLRTLYALSD